MALRAEHLLAGDNASRFPLDLFPQPGDNAVFPPRYAPFLSDTHTDKIRFYVLMVCVYGDAA